MRYRLQISRAELLAAVFPVIDGLGKMFGHHSDPDGSVWHFLNTRITPYLLISPPVLICLQYFYGYVELTPSSLEYHAMLRHRCIDYPQIERVVLSLAGSSWSSAETTEVYGTGIKKLSFKLEKTSDFLHELKQYAPQARMEDAANKK